MPRVPSRRASRSPFGALRPASSRAIDACLVFLGLLLLARALLLGASVSVDSTRDDGFTEKRGPASAAAGQFSSGVDMVQVTVTVVDGRRFVRGLPAGSFRVFEDGVSRPVAYFAADNVPLELLLALDVSSSMRKAIGQVKENASRFLSALPAEHQVTLISFNDELHLLAEPSASLDARLGAIAPLVPYGMTSLYDVMLRGLESLGQQMCRRGMVMFTDGEDTASHATSGAVEQRAETSDAVMYMIGHGQALKSPDLRELCVRLAERSGGRAFFPREPGDLRAAFDSILEELSSQYLLVYQPRSNSPDGKYHRIRVELADSRYEVRARQGYRYDPAATK